MNNEKHDNFLLKARKNKKKFLIVSLMILIFIFTIFTLNFPKPCGYTDGEVSQWEALFPDNSAYDMGINDYGRPVFKNAAKALSQAKKDYGDAIKVIQREFNLLPLTKYTYNGYSVYGWQINTDNDKIRGQGVKISQFFDIYEDSFSANIFH